MNQSEHYERNLKVIAAIKDAESNMSRPHSIEHHIYSYSEDEFEAVSKAGIGLGYQVLNSGSHEDKDGVFWSQDLVKQALPKIEEIEIQSIEIEDIVARYNSDYDGWGTEIEE
jgi:regulator of RNase E activity RraB